MYRQSRESVELAELHVPTSCPSPATQSLLGRWVPKKPWPPPEPVGPVTVVQSWAHTGGWGGGEREPALGGGGVWGGGAKEEERRVVGEEGEGGEVRRR